jgi:hypothetical protein
LPTDTITGKGTKIEKILEQAMSFGLKNIWPTDTITDKETKIEKILE